MALSLQILRPDLQRVEPARRFRGCTRRNAGCRSGNHWRRARRRGHPRDAARDRGGGRDPSPSKPERRRRAGCPRISRRSCSPRTGRARLSARRWTRRRLRRSRTCSAKPWRAPTLPALRAVARIVPHRSEPIRRIANPESLPHPDGRQPAKPLQGGPVPLPRRRDEMPRKRPSVMPDRLPRSRRQFGMHTNRKMSHSDSPAKPLIRMLQPLSFSSIPNDFATVKMSLSPRPHMFMQIM